MDESIYCYALNNSGKNIELISFLFIISFVEGLSLGNHKQQAKHLTRILEQEGYTVQEGGYDYVTPEKCQKLKSCYANNPSSPYGLIFLPKGPKEDVSTYSKWGELLTLEVNGVNLSSNYRLDANETILMLGQTPPRSLYYSYVTYVFDRWYPFNWSSPVDSKGGVCPNVTDPNGSRCELFASLGDPINMINMNTTLDNGDSFNSGFALFMGGDVLQTSHVKQLSVNAGIESNIQNTFPLSTSRINLGLTPTSDGLIHLLRTVFPENKDDHQNYIENPSKYITILRITPPIAGSGSESQKYPPNEFSERISKPETTENGLAREELQTLLENDIKRGVMQKYSQEYPFVNEFSLQAPIFDDGYDCMDRGLMCNGDNQDTLYPNSGVALFKSFICKKIFGDRCPIQKRMTLQEDGTDFFIVTGVNHNTTGSLYSSIAMYNVAKLESLGSFTSAQPDQDPFTYVGSADSFLQDTEAAKSFFVVKVSRKCGNNEKYCLQITKEGPNSLPLNASILFIERIYLDLLETGPTRDATVKPIVYHFSSKRK